MEEKKEFKTYLATVNDAYMPMIERQMDNHNIEFSPYSKQCVMNAISTINAMLVKQGIDWNNPQLDSSNITQVLLNIGSLKLNAAAEPSECYFQLRSEKQGDKWIKKIEMNIQGDGYDAILSNFGRGVKKVYPYWLVREHDDFTYPQYKGVELLPPTWIPKGTGEVVRVVYPILQDDNTIHYYIGEKEDVKRNLLAHISNNLMNETFGIAQDRYNATPEQLKKINEKKAELKRKAKELGFDALDDIELSKYISPSWKEDFSREQMIIRKMRNNVVKKIPKDFGSSLIQETYSTASNEDYRNAKNIIEAETASIDVEIIDTNNKELSKPHILTHEKEKDRTGINSPDNSKEPQKALNEPNVDTRQKPSFD